MSSVFSKNQRRILDELNKSGPGTAADLRRRIGRIGKTKVYAALRALEATGDIEVQGYGTMPEKGHPPRIWRIRTVEWCKQGLQLPTHPIRPELSPDPINHPPKEAPMPTSPNAPLSAKEQQLYDVLTDIPRSPKELQALTGFETTQKVHNAIWGLARRGLVAKHGVHPYRTYTKSNSTVITPPPLRDHSPPKAERAPVFTAAYYIREAIAALENALDLIDDTETKRKTVEDELRTAAELVLDTLRRK